MRVPAPKATGLQAAIGPAAAAGFLLRRFLGAVPHAWLACSLLAGCDPFGTREFSPRPAEARAFAGTLTRGDTIAFRIVESLADPGDAVPDTVLARRQVRFARAPDSLQASGDWIAMSFRVYADPPAAVLDEGVCHVRFAADGVSLRAPEASSAGAGGARYFPLKVSAAAGSAPADSLDVLSLPPVFALGGAWVQGLGPLTAAREIAALDTLAYRGRLEESWRIDETVSEGGRTVSRGTYWYGATGLLKGRQTWSLEERGDDGDLAALRELRRELVRL